MKIRGKCMEKANNISDVRVLCLNYPLDSDDLAKFYVDTSAARGVDMLKRLSLLFRFTPGVYPHILYMGHRSSGKSTLIYQLEQNLNETYSVIRFSVQDFLNMETMNFTDLLFIMYKQIYNLCEDFLLANDRYYSELIEIYVKWYASTEIEFEKVLTSEKMKTTGVDLNLKTKFIDLFSQISNIIKNGTMQKEIIHNNVMRYSTEYINCFNKLVEVASAYYGKPILVMIEDLEKISKDSIEKIFFNRSNLFLDIKVSMLLTAPISLKYSEKFNRINAQHFTLIERCPMIAVKNIDGTDNEIGIKTMRDIVYARISKDLIDKDSLEIAVKYSGGIIRDLFKILCEASLISEIDGRQSIGKNDIERAFVSLQESFSDILRDTHLNALKYINKNPQGLIIYSDVLNDLLCEEIVIEYNGEQWRGVHPAVLAFLDKHGLLTEDDNDKSTSS